MPLKIICFFWLSLLNKINTCDNLTKKGWIGPSWCCLCKSALESVDHLFHSCSFTRKVTALIKSSLDILDFLRGTNYHLNVSSWICLGNTLKYLPLLLAWQIWITRNKCIFEDLKPDIHLTVHAIKNQLQLFLVKLHLKNSRRLIGSAPCLTFSTGFFDRASTNLMGGIGVHLMLSNEHYFYFKMGIGLSTNTR